MNLAFMLASSNGTSANGAMFGRQICGAIALSVMLAGVGTTADAAPPANGKLRVRSADEQTTAGHSARQSEAAGAAIAELRRLSGLTWDQLARLFDVRRRSLHFWASGKPSTPSNEEKLHRLLAVMQKVARASGDETRAALLSPSTHGRIPFDLLAEGRFEEATALLGTGPGVPPARSLQISERERMARKPPPPATLVDALQDSIHLEQGPVRAARSKRHRSGD